MRRQVRFFWCDDAGSGKTAGFLFPLICSMLREGPTKRELTRTRVTQYLPTSLVLSPTRELAMQINEEAQRVGVRLRAET